MPRKRTISDEALLDSALLIVREDGPDALSFGALSSRVGLAGSTIVQRFGSKANLLHAALGVAWDRLEAETDRAIAVAPLDAEGVVELLVALSGQYDSDDDADHYADQLLLLREDLRDPRLRARGEAWIATLTEAIERRLLDVPGGPAGLGEIVVAQWQGALTVWGFIRHDSVEAVVRRHLHQLLARLSAAPASRPRSSGRARR